MSKEIYYLQLVIEKNINTFEDMSLEYIKNDRSSKVTCHIKVDNKLFR